MNERLSKEEALKTTSHIQRHGSQAVIGGVIVYTLKGNSVTFNPASKVFTLVYNHEVYTS